jgi:hypothetical protein
LGQQSAATVWDKSFCSMRAICGYSECQGRGGGREKLTLASEIGLRGFLRIKVHLNPLDLN